MMTSIDEEEEIRVLHIASGDLWAGAEVQIYNMITALLTVSRTRLQVVLLNQGELEQRLRKSGVKVLVYDENRMDGIRILLEIYRCIRRFRPHIVHTHRQKENILGSVAAAFAHDVMSVRTVHGAQEITLKPRQLVKRMYRYADQLCGCTLQKKIIAVSHPLAKELVGYYGDKRLTTVLNGINIELLESRTNGNVHLPGGDGKIRVAIVARLVPVKRIDLFLKIANDVLHKGGSGYTFYIFGDGPLLESIKRLVHQLHIEHSVHMMGHKANIAPYLSKMDILLITSDHEGMPMNLLEAMALKVPVIARAVGGIPDVLENGKCGMLINGQEIGRYTEAILAYRQNKLLFREMAMHAYEAVKKKYSANQCALQYYQVYRSLVYGIDRKCDEKIEGEHANRNVRRDVI